MKCYPGVVEGGSRVEASEARQTRCSIRARYQTLGLVTRKHLEDAEAQTLMQILQLKLPTIADLIFHIPNGGKRAKFEAFRLQKQGTKAGVPDYFLPIAVAPYHGLYLELKAQKGTLQKSQKEWIEKLKNQGYQAVVAYGAEDAFLQISNYLKGG